MSKTKITPFLVLLLMFFTNLSYPQFVTDHSDITNEDLINALSFAGLDIFKFNLDSLKNDCNLLILSDEYAGKNNLIRTDTLLNINTLYKKWIKDTSWIDDYINQIRFITKVENDSWDKVKLYIDTKPVGTKHELTIDKKYARKHYWVKFSKSKLALDKKIPLLFLGSEWDDIIGGKKVPRFCSHKNISPDLSDETIKFIPHFYIISYLLKAKEI